MATKYGCPECEFETPLEVHWQTAFATLRKHRKEHYGEAFGKIFPMPKL